MNENKKCKRVRFFQKISIKDGNGFQCIFSLCLNFCFVLMLFPSSVALTKI